jgi:hypothetical protein
MHEQSGGSSTDSKLKRHPMAAALKVDTSYHELPFINMINSLVQEFSLE